MQMSRLYAPTLKEDPREAELASHKLLLRAGMMRRGAVGLYSYLPLAWRSINKIEDIIRDEMEAIDAQEMQVPILTDGDLWHQSGRWNDYGPELMRLSDRYDHEYALGPTHEETFTDLVRNELRSYKQLPVTLYQMQDKFRDERRPRFGLMRSREFIMKDGYSFSATQESLQECYDQEKQAYAKICERVGLRALPVVADSGQIGGDTSVEFMAIADAGEAALVYCDDCGFAADTEAATAAINLVDGEAGDLEKVETPGASTIEALARFLNVPEAGTRKALALVDGDGKPVVCFVPGDHELNDVKAEHAFGAYHMMTEDELKEFGLVKGFIGPIGLPEGVRACYDVSLRESQWWAIGANEPGYHYVHAKPGRDFQIADGDWVDIITAKEGDVCPKCGAPLKAARGIEVSQVFQLGTKYSAAMGATFMDEDGVEKPLIMGCYGIGISRTLQAIVEQHHDEHGIIWPVSVAPYEVEVIPLDVHDDLVWPVADKVASQLVDLGIDVLVDDRKERPGVKFNDADLMGMPYQVVCGKKAVKNGNVELKNRATGERTEVAIDKVAALLAQKVKAQRA
ncbi:MAG: proline--tRNA ligase [Parafannyhessea sp.]|uniref:proline--tRNA ligase n=1 Tax=Parafannyhessea sp. TaxID=2847324 RepID=UPI003F083183